MNLGRIRLTRTQLPRCRGDSIRRSRLWSRKRWPRSRKRSRSDKHYDNFIGGKWVPPVKGQKFENITPIDGSVVCTIARSTAEDIELALDAAHAAKDGWGRASPADRARVSQQDRRPDGGEARSPGSGRSDRQRQADPRDQGRRPAAGDRSFPLLRRLHPCPGRQLERDRPRYRRLSFPRAAGRGRADHPLELPAAHGGMEAGAGAGRGELRGA